MEQGCTMSDETWMYCRRTVVMSPEIVEIGEDGKSLNAGSINNNVSICFEDVYVGVGKDDIDVVKWVLEQYGSTSCRVFLVHVYPPIAQVSTPVGMLLRSQMAQDQVRYYSNQEDSKRSALLQKYIQLCQSAKVTVETMLIESNNTAKAILDLITVLNITKLVMGTKRSPPLRCELMLRRWMRSSIGKGEYVKKNAPESCVVTTVFHGKNAQQDGTRPSLERNFLNCVCYSGQKETTSRE